MSTAPGFFQSEAVRALLARASRAAGVPLAIHYLMDGHEGPLVLGFGGCAACKYLATVSGGKAACRTARSAISWNALGQARPVAGLRHLGFGVLAAPALADEGYALSFGPFVPAQSDASIEYDALEGLANLSGGGLLENFPVPLDDIHRVPPGSLPALADWVTEELAILWSKWTKVETPVEEEIALNAMPGGTARAQVISAAQVLTTAIAGGNRKRMRALVLAFVSEIPRARRSSEAVLGARLLALLADTIAACAKAGIDTAPAMALLPEAAIALRKLNGATEAAECALRVLFVLQQQPQKRLTASLLEYRALDRLLTARLPESLPLAEASAALGKSPAAISRHLQRHFGMNYSEYQGRLRVERAKDYLRRTQLSATEIGKRVGIDDQSNFVKLFKRHAAMTPLEYRARHGTAQEPRRKKPRP